METDDDRPDDVELPEEVDSVSLPRWQHKLLSYLAKERPDVLQNLLDGECDVNELSSDEEEALRHEDGDKESATADLPVLSTRTDIPKTLAEAKASPDPIVRGFLQQQGRHYSKTYAAVVNGTATKAIFAVGTARGWKSQTIDFVAAFLYGKLDPSEVVIVELPTGINHGRGQLVGLLRPGLYGLKQAARIWYFTAVEYLQSLGFRVSPYDAGLRIHTTRRLYLTLHIDDCRILSPSEADVDWVVHQISCEFEIRDVTNQRRYLGLKLYLQPDDLGVSRPQYIKDLEDFGMEDCNATLSSMSKGLRIEFSPPGEAKTSLDDGFSESNYQRGMGALQFLATSTRPEIAFAVNYLSRYVNSPNRVCWLAFKQILRYLRRTVDKGLLFGALGTDDDLYPVAYSDPDWAGADPAYRSTSGYVILMNGAPVACRSQRRTSTAKSTTEAEYIAASEAASDAGILEAPGTLHTANLNIDNKGAIDLAASEAYPPLLPYRNSILCTPRPCPKGRNQPTAHRIDCQPGRRFDEAFG
ncbi:hypothetical protein VTO42DRAFT_6195 [Malbranchea cinnamomea]